MNHTIRYVLLCLLIGGLVNVGLSDLATTPTTNTGTQPDTFSRIK
jgi:hypothetical protein